VIRRFLSAESGNIAILFALLFGLMGIAAAFAVDAGSLYLEKRRVQSAVDLAAIAASRDPLNAFAIARQVIADAGFVPAGVTVEMLRDPESPTRLGASSGLYTANRHLDAGERFRPSAGAVNAVRVSFQTPGRLFFANSWSPIPQIAASAIASRDTLVAFSIGSRLASLSDGLPNALLNALLGTSIELGAVDYNGLLNVEASLFAFLDALALELDLTAGTYDDLLAMNASPRQLVTALAAVVSQSDAALARTLAGALADDGTIGIGRLVQLGTLGALQLHAAGEPMSVMVSALDLLGASAVLADGVRQVALRHVLDVAGLIKVAASVTIGEPPQASGWLSVGPTGTVVRTAPVRVLLTTEVPGQLALVPITVRLPVYLEVAAAEAVVASATCPSAAAPHGAATIAVKPGVARLIVGTIDEHRLVNFMDHPAVGAAKLVNVLGLVGVSASALVEVAQSTPVSLSFASSEIAAGTVKTASTRTVVGSLAGTLLGKTKPTVDLLAIPLLRADAVLGIVSGLITPLAPGLDATLASLLDTAGLGIGEADLRVYGVSCSHPVLVG